MSKPEIHIEFLLVAGKGAFSRAAGGDSNNLALYRDMKNPHHSAPSAAQLAVTKFGIVTTEAAFTEFFGALN